jgi:hypothetical protein
MPTKQTRNITLSMVLFVPTTLAIAQSGIGEKDNSSWVGVVTSDTANVRCGANESYYTVAKAKEGDLIRVHGKRQDWIKIDTSGAVFENTIGYIKYPANETSLFEVIGNSGLIRGDLEVLARNTESEELYRSWRPILRLQDGDRVSVIETNLTKPGTLHRDAYVVHTVQMPSGATCWVHASSIAAATPEQTAMYAGLDYIKTTPATTSTSNTSNEDVANAALGTESSGEIVESATATLGPLSLVELEAAWEKMSSEPVMGAEVAPLRDMYAELLSENGEDLVIEQIAAGRMKQLEVWAGLQSQRVRIEALRANLAEQSDEVGEFRTAMSLYGDYAMAGKLALSNTFDGRLRPFMYRVQDVKSGRTLGYLAANEDWGLPSLVGQTVGIVGKNTWNPSWSVYVVEAERFDILSPSTATVTPDIQ